MQPRKVPRFQLALLTGCVPVAELDTDEDTEDNDQRLDEDVNQS